jgi:hypothetical protein
MRRRSQRQFFRKVFLPESHLQGIGIVRALGVLEESRYQFGANPRIGALVAALPVLHEVLREISPTGNAAEAMAVLERTYPTPPSPKRTMKLSTLGSDGPRSIEAVFKEQQELDAAARFVRLVGQNFKSDTDAGVAVAVLFVTAIALIAVAATFLSEGMLAIGIVGAIIGAVIAAVVVHRQFRRWTQRRFFRNTFLPAAHYQGISVARAIGVMDEIRRTDSAMDPGVGSMAKALPILQEILKKASPGGDVSDAVAALARSYPARPKPPTSYKWVTPVVIAVVLLGCVGVVGLMSSKHEDRRLKQEAAVNAYAAPFLARIAEFTPAAPEREIQPPYRHGKVMPIVLPGKGIDNILLSFPDVLRPANPDEVGTIVWLQWGKETIGFYTDHTEAFVITCHVTVIDKSKNIIIEERDFVGSDPPQQRKPGEPNHGSNPAGDITRWLMGMPAK